MHEKDILCATDLTLVSDEALRAANAMATRFSTKVTLLHALDRKEQSPEARTQVVARMNEQIAHAGATARITPSLQDGDFMKVIANESAAGHALLVLGTHGPRCLRQNLFGADILKLVRHAATPCLVVQEGFNLERLLQRIILPVAAHADIDSLVEMVVALAKGFAADVHVFQLIRPGEEPSPELLANKAKMLARLQAENIRHEEVNEPSTTFSVGFADATIRYAERVGAGAIAIMAHASDEFRYIADAEKERLLANEPRIPILCA